MANQIDYANKITDDLDTLYITAAGYIRYPFKGVSRDSAWAWEEPVWGGELTRSTDLILTNIDKVDFGLVYRCEISYKYMNIKDYKVLMEIAKQRVCYVDFFNREKGQREEREMAFTGNELGKLYAFGSDYLGVTDVSIKLVATNREKAKDIAATHKVTYNTSGGFGVIQPDNVRWSEMITLPKGDELSKPGYEFKGWEERDLNNQVVGRYRKEQEVTIWKDLDLYAIWEAE